MKYFDAHTHLHFPAYDADRDETVRRALDAGVGMNMVGTGYETSLSAVSLAEKYDGVYATIGLHPTHAEGSEAEVFDADRYKELAKSRKVIAVGECGLDYYRLDPETRERQTAVFREQIEMAIELGLPLMLHIRPTQGTQNAYEDALQVLSAYPAARGDVHFFAGNWEIARQFLDRGFTLSFTGVVTFTHDYDEVVRNTPLDRMLSETDAPYITPVPHRGKRNESAFIPDIVRALARIKGEDETVVAESLMRNARTLFRL